jgi:hypothetical protein
VAGAPPSRVSASGLTVFLCVRMPPWGGCLVAAHWWFPLIFVVSCYCALCLWLRHRLGSWSVLLPRANSMFLAGGPPPSNHAGDDTIECVPNESSSVEHLCRAGCCAGGDSQPLPVPLRPPPRSNILDIRSIVSLFLGLPSCVRADWWAPSFVGLA